ncbi:MAG: hypothetical protein F4Y21_07075 [Gemmatimonadetes bacterium]|nr:hypothetical protein [Gemmatimonadota bacterium]
MKSLLVRSLPVSLRTVVMDAHSFRPSTSPLSCSKRPSSPHSRTALPVTRICWSISTLGLKPSKTPRLSPPTSSSIQVCCQVIAALFSADISGGSTSPAPSVKAGRLPSRHSWLCTDSGSALTPS